MNKKLLSVAMSGVMVASACSTGVSAASTAKSERNFKPFVIGGAIAGTAVVGGIIAWLANYNKNIEVTCKVQADDLELAKKLEDAIRRCEKRIEIVGVKLSNIDALTEMLKQIVDKLNSQKATTTKVKWNIKGNLKELGNIEGRSILLDQVKKENSVDIIPCVQEMTEKPKAEKKEEAEKKAKEEAEKKAKEEAEKKAKEEAEKKAKGEAKAERRFWKRLLCCR